MDPDLEPPYPQTIGEILAGNAARLPHEAALVDPAGPRVDFAGIQSAAAAFRARLRALGVGPQDRVAVVLPNGAEPSLLLLGLLSSAVATPLHPNLTTAELGSILPRLRPAALLDLGGHPAAGVESAHGRDRTRVPRPAEILWSGDVPNPAGVGDGR